MQVTALQSLHLLERIYVRDAMVPPGPESLAMHWAGTSLSIAGVHLLIGEGELAEIIETPVVTKIPGTKSWVMGIATHKGSLLPVFSGDAFFRKTPYAGRPREYCMVVRHSGFHFGMTISAIERDLKFPVEERDMECLIDPAFAEITLGGFHRNGKVLAVLDVQKLVTDGDFLNASVIEGDSSEENDR